MIAKKQYANLLRQADKNAYNNYKRMSAPSKSTTSAQSARETNSISHLKSETHAKKLSYAKFMLMRNQSSYPFGQTEKRFKWQNLKDPSNPIGLNDKGNSKKHFKRKNSFDGGFLEFFLKKNSSIDATNTNKHHTIDYSDSSKIKPSKRQCSVDNINTIYSTQRVIVPEHNVINIYILYL